MACGIVVPVTQCAVAAKCGTKANPVLFTSAHEARASIPGHLPFLDCEDIAALMLSRADCVPVNVDEDCVGNVVQDYLGVGRVVVN